MSFQEKLDAYRARVECALKQYLPNQDLPQTEVFEAAQYSVGAGGKRIRPVLLLAFCEALGGDVEKALPFAAAVEFLHTYSLIHDDLPCMDNDDMRRGKPSCHVQFGEATALLAGDGLLNLAFETMLTACKETKEVQAAAILARASGMMGMIGGQIVDLQSADRPISEELLLEMYRMKTGELLAASCKMGVCLAGGTEQQISLASEYGFRVGLAFQIVDDILDIYGDEKTLGKHTGSDWDNHKLTYAALHSRDGSVRKAKMLTDEAIALLVQCCPDNSFLPELTEKLLNRVK